MLSQQQAKRLLSVYNYQLEMLLILISRQPKEFNYLYPNFDAVAEPSLEAYRYKTNDLELITSINDALTVINEEGSNATFFPRLSSINHQNLPNEAGAYLQALLSNDYIKSYDLSALASFYFKNEELKNQFINLLKQIENPELISTLAIKDELINNERKENKVNTPIIPNQMTLYPFRGNLSWYLAISFPDLNKRNRFYELIGDGKFASEDSRNPNQPYPMLKSSCMKTLFIPAYTNSHNEFVLRFPNQALRNRFYNIMNESQPMAAENLPLFQVDVNAPPTINEIIYNNLELNRFNHFHPLPLPSSINASITLSKQVNDDKVYLAIDFSHIDIRDKFIKKLGGITHFPLRDNFNGGLPCLKIDNYNATRILIPSYLTKKNELAICFPNTVIREKFINLIDEHRNNTLSENTGRLFSVYRNQTPLYMNDSINDISLNLSNKLMQGIHFPLCYETSAQTQFIPEALALYSSNNSQMDFSQDLLSAKPSYDLSDENIRINPDTLFSCDNNFTDFPQDLPYNNTLSLTKATSQNKSYVAINFVNQELCERFKYYLGREVYQDSFNQGLTCPLTYDKQPTTIYIPAFNAKNNELAICFPSLTMRDRFLALIAENNKNLALNSNKALFSIYNGSLPIYINDLNIHNPGYSIPLAHASLLERKIVNSSVSELAKLKILLYKSIDMLDKNTTYLAIKFPNKALRDCFKTLLGVETFAEKDPYHPDKDCPRVFSDNTLALYFPAYVSNNQLCIAFPTSAMRTRFLDLIDGNKELRTNHNGAALFSIDDKSNSILINSSLIHDMHNKYNIPLPLPRKLQEVDLSSQKEIANTSTFFYQPVQRLIPVVNDNNCYKQKIG